MTTIDDLPPLDEYAAMIPYLGTPEEQALREAHIEGYEAALQQVEKDLAAQAKAKQETGAGLRITYASKIKPKRMRWLWAPDGTGVIPLGTGTIAAGMGGEGKSTFMLDIAAQLTRGTLPGDLHGEKHPVIVFGPEDDWPTVMVPRLIAAGADLDMVAQVQAETITDDVTRERELKFPLDLALLGQAIEQTGARMVIIDPAPSMMNGDMNRVQEVRSAYDPLLVMAQSMDFSPVLINHFGKGAGSVSAKLSGSHAWRDLTRSYLAFATDDQTGERIVTQDKNNYGTSLGSWKFTLESTDVSVDGGTTSVGKVRFLGASDVTVGEVINRGAGDDDDDDDRNAAQAFILDYLKSKDGWEAKAGEIIKAGLAEGFSKDEMKKARARCKSPRVASVKGQGYQGGWVWQLTPDTEHVFEEPGPIGATHPPKVPKVPKVPAHENTAPMAPMTPMTTSMAESSNGYSNKSCPLHGTKNLIGCYTCDELRTAS